MRDGWRLAVGTLTALPVAAPGRVDARAARRAILLGPLAVLPLGAGAAALCLLPLPDPAAAVLVVGFLALATRALHWDGLSDTVDGLTASYDRERSLAVMRSGTSGPAGVVATVVVLGLQAGALTAYVGSLRGALLAGLAVCLSRCVLWVVCAAPVPAARTEGLGNPFAGVVPTPVAVVGAVLAGVVPGLVVLALARRCTSRLGGVTGDVMGAAVEVGLAVLLLCGWWLA